jgi:RarD protein
MNSKQGPPLMAGNLPDGAVAGALAAVGAFGIWAVFPIYFSQFGPGVSPWEILLHRVIWTVVFLLGFILVSGRLHRVFALLKRPRTMLALAGSALALGANWATFLWAVTHAQILQSSLGYYINPLLNVFLGYCFLSERLHPLQWLAVGIAAAGVLISLVGYGHVPWLALIMAGCFGLYGLIRKQVQIDSVTGLMVEALLMSPIAVVWLVVMVRYHHHSSAAAFCCCRQASEAGHRGADAVYLTDRAFYQRGFFVWGIVYRRGCGDLRLYMDGACTVHARYVAVASPRAAGRDLKPAAFNCRG